MLGLWHLEFLLEFTSICEQTFKQTTVPSALQHLILFEPEIVLGKFKPVTREWGESTWVVGRTADGTVESVVQYRRYMSHSSSGQLTKLPS